MAHDRLLDVALSAFGQHGLEGASTRGIAAAAGTAMSSITYHYGGKEGLYAAVATRIEAEMAAEWAELLPDDRSPPDPIEARAEMHRLLDRLAVKFIAGGDTASSLFIMREQMQPTVAFDRFYGGTMGRLARRLAALVRAVTGLGDEPARIVAVTLFGQVMVWRSSRAMIARLMSDGIDPSAGGADRTAAIRARIARNTDHILDGLRTDQQEPQ